MGRAGMPSSEPQMLNADPVSYSVAFAAGFVSFASPCVLPLVPAYLGVVSVWALTISSVVAGRVLPTAAFVAGSHWSSWHWAQAWAVRDVSARTATHAGDRRGLFVIAMGLSCWAGYSDVLDARSPLSSHDAAGDACRRGPGGRGVRVRWTPCIGPTLGAALTLAAGSGVGFCGSLLLAYGLGMGIPFLLAGCSSIRRPRRWACSSAICV